MIPPSKSCGYNSHRRSSSWRSFLLLAFSAAILKFDDAGKISAVLGVLTTFLGTAIGVLSGAHSGQVAASTSAAAAAAANNATNTANKVAQQATALLSSSREEAVGLRQQLDGVTRQYQLGAQTLHSMVAPQHRARANRVMDSLRTSAPITGVVPFITDVVTAFIGGLRHMDPGDVDTSLSIEAEPPDGQGFSRGAYRDMCADCESKMQAKYGPDIKMDDDWRTKNELGTVNQFIGAAADLVYGQPQ